jgi:hypothetical protein
MYLKSTVRVLSWCVPPNINSILPEVIVRPDPSIVMLLERKIKQEILGKVFVVKCVHESFV